LLRAGQCQIYSLSCGCGFGFDSVREARLPSRNQAGKATASGFQLFQVKADRAQVLQLAMGRCPIKVAPIGDVGRRYSQLFGSRYRQRDGNPLAENAGLGSGRRLVRAFGPKDRPWNIWL
jgi:hypothetical protein